VIAVCCAIDLNLRNTAMQIFIDETNIFFILLTIILQVLDRCTQELKVSYFSDYLLFFLAVALNQCALAVSIC
jgi:hypothetical protein